MNVLLFWFENTSLRNPHPPWCYECDVSEPDLCIHVVLTMKIITPLFSHANVDICVELPISINQCKLYSLISSESTRIHGPPLWHSAVISSACRGSDFMKWALDARSWWETILRYIVLDGTENAVREWHVKKWQRSRKKKKRLLSRHCTNLSVGDVTLARMVKLLLTVRRLANT